MEEITIDIPEPEEDYRIDHRETLTEEPLFEDDGIDDEGDLEEEEDSDEDIHGEDDSDDMDESDEDSHWDDEIDGEIEDLFADKPDEVDKGQDMDIDEWDDAEPPKERAHDLEKEDGLDIDAEEDEEDLFDDDDIDWDDDKDSDSDIDWED